MADIQIVKPGQSMTRKTRTPTFPVQGGIKPYGLYPLMFTPVLPGETLSMASTRMTITSSPLVNPLSGSHYETWTYYVRLTDIARELAGMFIGDETVLRSTYEATSDKPQFFTKTGQVKWCELCTKVVYEHDFLDEGDDPDQTQDFVPRLKIINRDWRQSVVKQDADDNVAPPAAQEDQTRALQAYLSMRHMGMASLSFEEYLKTYGVSSVKVEEGQPELLHYRRYWTLPANTIDPATGQPSGVWYWQVDEKHDRQKMFKEPGFVIQFHAVRPKLYDAALVASMVNNLWGFEDFFPSYTMQDPVHRIREMDETNPVLDDTTFTSADFPIWWDMADLLSHGEQFMNGNGRFTPPTTSWSSMDDAAIQQRLRGKFPLLSSLNNLFLGTAAEDKFLDYEGLVTMSIKGHIEDLT